MTDGNVMRASARAGMVGGVLAALVMGVVAMARSGAADMGFWLPLKLIAAVFWNVEALIGGALVVVVGLMIHMAVGGMAGLAFALIIRDRLSAGSAMLAGVACGLAIWTVNTWLLLPAINPVMLDRQLVAPGWWVGYHVIFGAMLFTVPLLVRRFRPRAHREYIGHY